MKLIKFSIIAIILGLSVQFAQAQSVSFGVRFGYGHPYYPYHRVIVERPYPAYGYYGYPVYYHRPHYIYRGYYERPAYVSPYYMHRRYYYRRHW